MTCVLPFVDFRENTEQYRSYYAQDPQQPFCVRYIQPKLDAVERALPSLYRPHATHRVEQADPTRAGLVQ